MTTTDPTTPDSAARADAGTAPGRDAEQTWPRIDYHVYGIDAEGGYVVDRLWSDMVVEGHVPDLDTAYAWADRVLAADARVFAVAIVESVQDEPGQVWHHGKGVDCVHRDPVDYNVLTPVIEVLPARSRREALAEHARLIERKGMEVYEHDPSWPSDAFVSES